MIPYLNISPDIYALDSPPTTDDFGLLDDISNLINSDVEMFSHIEMFSQWRCEMPHNEEFELDDKPDSNLNQYLLKDCKLSGCDAECAKHHSVDFGPNDLIDPNLVYPEEDMHDHEDVQPYTYTPDSDHSYYALSKEVPVKPASEPYILENIPTPPSSFTTSDSSSEDEVDVVTVPPDFELPTMPIIDTPRKNTRSQRKVSKQQKRKTQTAVSAKSLKAAIKKTRLQNLHNLQRTKQSAKANRGQKVYYNNSVETTPSSSVPSSAQSSRCNSDTEDCDKREVHNNSERKRREAQRTALQNLRHRIPALRHNLKAPKVLILNTAKQEIDQLENLCKKYEESILFQKQKKEELRAKFHELASDLFT